MVIFLARPRKSREEGIGIFDGTEKNAKVLPAYEDQHKTSISMLRPVSMRKSSEQNVGKEARYC